MIKKIFLYTFLFLGLVTFLVFINHKSSLNNTSQLQEPNSYEEQEIMQGTDSMRVLMEIDGHAFENLDPKEETKTQKTLISIGTTFLKMYYSVFPKEGVNHLNSYSVRALVNYKNTLRIEQLLKLFGPEKVMQRLFEESDSGNRFNCHGPAHTIGRLSYMVFKESAVEKPISLCASGYVHGMLGTFVKDRGVKDYLEYVPALCNKFETGFDRLECYHSSGHGLMGAVNGDLTRAIGLCSKFKTDFQRNNCYAGAFMEDYSPVSKEAQGKLSKQINLQDPHLTCQKFVSNIKAAQACYALHFPWVSLNLMKKSMDEVSDMCLKAPKELITSCLFGYGQMAGLQAKFDSAKTIQFCDGIEDAIFKNACLKGGQTVIMDFWGVNIKNQGKDFCSEVPIIYKGDCIKSLELRIKAIRS